MRRSALWLEAMRDVDVRPLMQAHGMRELGRRASSVRMTPCPACRAERLTKRAADRPGPLLVNNDRPGRWKCLQCEAVGDAIDLLAYHVGGRRFRDLDRDAKAEVRARALDWLSRSPSPVEGGAGTPAPATDAARSQPNKPKRPPPTADELGAVWGRAQRPDSEPAVAEYLRRRGLDPVRLSDLGIVGLLPADARVPRWAYAARQEGLRLMLKRCDHRGDGRTILFRRCVPAASGDAKKTRMPLGAPCRGMTLQCPLARQVMKHGVHPSQWPTASADPECPFGGATPWWPAERTLELVITEGEMDFLAWVQRAGDADEYAPAVVGIVSGWWTAEHSQRIPDGTRVLIATDNDQAGDDYAALIARTFAGRSVSLRRYRYDAGERRAAA